MTVKILLGDKIRNELLKVLSGISFWERHKESPRLYVFSPWISNVEIEFGDLRPVNNREKRIFVDYFGIKSINLPYALLLRKLHQGVEVNIIALPPTEKYYFTSQYASKVKVLYDFLDEIGCNVFVNPNLHTKLILANDLALLGSFNLSKSALYDREEIGVSIDDFDNLRMLDNYALKTMYSSQP